MFRMEAVDLVRNERSAGLAEEHWSRDLVRLGFARLYLESELQQRRSHDPKRCIARNAVVGR